MAFKERYDSRTCREENSELLAALSSMHHKEEDDDEHATLKKLVGNIETITPVPEMRHRGSDSKSRILLQAVSAEPCYLHVESKVTYPCYFTAMVEAPDSSIRVVKSQAESGPSRTTGARLHPTILTTDKV